MSGPFWSESFVSYEGVVDPGSVLSAADMPVPFEFQETMFPSRNHVPDENIVSHDNT